MVSLNPTLPYGGADFSPLSREADWPITPLADGTFWGIFPYADATDVPEIPPHGLIFPSSPYERTVSSWRMDVAADFSPRAAARRPDKLRLIIYTDAAANPPMLCALLFHGNRSTPALRTACSARAPAAWPYLFRRTCLIYGLEFLALVLFRDDRDASLRGEC